MTRSRLFFIPVFFLLSCLWTGCASEPPLNVVIVTFDTTRADYLDLYDGPAPTPNLNELARDSLVFEQAISPVPITLPSHSSLMTGKVPFAHGVRDNGLFELGGTQTTLAEILQAEGYATGAAIGSFPLLSRFGIHQGFEFFDDHITAPVEDYYGERVIPKRELYFDERPAGQVNAALFPWLEDHVDRPFFLWAHYFDPHFPHTPPSPYNQRFAHDLYAGEIAYADEALGALIAKLRDAGVYERTIIVVTADHGEGMGEHNESTHSLLAYNSTLHIPLVIKPPTGVPSNQRIAARVGLVDIFPTVLEWLNIDVPDDIQGQSLVRHLNPEGTPLTDRVIYAETLSPRINHEWGELRALYVDELKYIHGPRPELFDIAADPRELDDLIAERPDDAARLKSNLESYLDRYAVDGLDASVAIDDETAQRLMALGYLQPSRATVGQITEELRDDGDPPQDRAVTISMYSHAKQLMFDNNWLDSREVLERLLRLDPDNGHYLDLLALVESRLGRFDRALEILESIPRDAVVPPRFKVLEAKGNLYIAKGDSRAALETLRDSQALQRSAVGQQWIADLYRQAGDKVQHERHLRAALEEDPDFVPARLDLAVVLAEAGYTDEARVELERTLEDHPFFPRGHFNYAVFLTNNSEPEAAIEHFRRAVTLDPDYHKARSALVEILVSLDQEDEAIEHYLALAARAPGSDHTEIAARALELDL
ncbi:MAG: sulfatase-like hydrolase/transferase [Acidobacteriota bacterium]